MTLATVLAFVTVTALLVFSRLSRFAASGRVERWIKAVTGVVFVGFGLKLATMRA